MSQKNKFKVGCFCNLHSGCNLCANLCAIVEKNIYEPEKVWSFLFLITDSRSISGVGVIIWFFSELQLKCRRVVDTMEYKRVIEQVKQTIEAVVVSESVFMR